MNEVFIKREGTMECPVCKKLMWDNRGRKTNPKAPDYRCKDPECKYSLNSDTGEYEEGEFVTGVWFKEPEPPKIKPQLIPKPLTSNLKDNSIDNSMKSMLLSYAKDITVAQINAGKNELGVNEVIQDYKKLLGAL